MSTADSAALTADDASPRASRSVAAAVAIVVLGACGAYITVVLPAIVKLLVENAGVSGTNAGYIVGAEKLGMMASSLGLTWVVDHWNRRKLAAGFLVALTVGNVLSATIHGFVPLCAARLLCGASEGGVIALMTAAAAASGSADRTFGMYLAVTLGLAMLGFKVMPALLAAGGLPAIFYAMAAVSALVTLTVPWYPSERGGDADARDARSKAPVLDASVKRRIAMALAATLLFEACIGAVWNYIALIGTASRYTEADVGAGLAQAMVVGIAGGLVSSVVGDRFGRAWPLAIGVGAILVSQLCILLAPGQVPFLVVSMLFMGAWMFTLPYFVGAVSALDPSGRAAVFSIVVQTGGLMTGPVVAAEVIRGNDAYRHILWVGIACASACLALVLPAVARITRGAARAQHDGRVGAA